MTTVELARAEYRLAGLAFQRFPDGWPEDKGLADYVRCATAGCTNAVPARNGATGALPRFCVQCKRDRLAASKKASRDRKAGKIPAAQPWTPPAGSPAAPTAEGPYPEHGGGPALNWSCESRPATDRRVGLLYETFGKDLAFTVDDITDTGALERLEGRDKDQAAQWLAENDPEHGESSNLHGCIHEPALRAP
jgi:hypothetical protein